MEIQVLKKMVNSHVDDIDKRLSIIESNEKKLNNWSNLRRAVTQNDQKTDESVLKEMINYFGEGCLKALIREVANDFIKDFEDKITAQSSDLKMIVKPKIEVS